MNKEGRKAGGEAIPAFLLSLFNKVKLHSGQRRLFIALWLKDWLWGGQGEQPTTGALGAGDVAFWQALGAPLEVVVGQHSKGTIVMLNNGGQGLHPVAGVEVVGVADHLVGGRVRRGSDILTSKEKG